MGGAAPQPQNEPKFKLYIGNLAKSVNNNSLFQFFSRKNITVKNCSIAQDVMMNPRGYGYAAFYKHEDAQRALDLLNNEDLEGQKIRLMWYTKKEDRDQQKGNLYVKELDLTVD